MECAARKIATGCRLAEGIAAGLKRKIKMQKRVGKDVTLIQFIYNNARRPIN